MVCSDIRGGSLDWGRQTMVGLPSTAIFIDFGADFFGNVKPCSHRRLQRRRIRRLSPNSATFPATIVFTDKARVIFGDMQSFAGP